MKKGLKKRRNYSGDSNSVVIPTASSSDDTTACLEERRQLKFGIVYDEPAIICRHRGPPEHPERPERVLSVVDFLKETGVFRVCHLIPARNVTDKELFSAHNSVLRSLLQDYESSLTVGDTSASDFVGELLLPSLAPEPKATSVPKEWVYVTNADTYVANGSLEVASRAAGATLHLVDKILNTSVNNDSESDVVESGFALVRPPGHHAAKSGCMGFCIYNNLAIAAMHIVNVYKMRVLILDWDVHHGNGTHDILSSCPSVCFISIHRYFNAKPKTHSFFPGTGGLQEMSRKSGKAIVVNVPLEVGYGDEDMHAVFSYIVVPSIHSFKPDIILVSAGFDACKGDPIGMCNISREAYSWMSATVAYMADLYCKGRFVFVLEGGYSLESLKHCVYESITGALQAKRNLRHKPNPYSEMHTPGDLIPGAPASLLSWAHQAARLNHKDSSYFSEAPTKLRKKKSGGCAIQGGVPADREGVLPLVLNSCDSTTGCLSSDPSGGQSPSSSHCSTEHSASSLRLVYASSLSDDGPELNFLRGVYSQEMRQPASGPDSGTIKTLYSAHFQRKSEVDYLLCPSSPPSSALEDEDDEYPDLGFSRLMCVPRLSTWLVIRNVIFYHRISLSLVPPTYDLVPGKMPLNLLSNLPYFDSISHICKRTADTCMTNHLLDAMGDGSNIKNQLADVGCSNNKFSQLGGHSKVWMAPFMKCGDSPAIVKNGLVEEGAFYDFVRRVLCSSARQKGCTLSKHAKDWMAWGTYFCYTDDKWNQCLWNILSTMTQELSFLEWFNRFQSDRSSKNSSPTTVCPPSRKEPCPITFDVSNIFPKSAEQLDLLVEELVRFLPFLPRICIVEPPSDIDFKRYVDEKVAHRRKFENEQIKALIESIDGVQVPSTPVHLKRPKCSCKIEMENAVEFESHGRGPVEGTNIIDIKIGTRLYGDDADPFKMKKMISKANMSTCKDLGIVLVGVKHSKFSSDLLNEAPHATNLLESVVLDRTVCRSAGFKGLICYIRKFLLDQESKASPWISVCVISIILLRLEMLREQFQRQTVFHFFSSSLLIAFDAPGIGRTIFRNDGSKAELRQCALHLLDTTGGTSKSTRAVETEFGIFVRLKMIDFAHVSLFHSEIDSSYLRGIESLTKIMRNFLKEFIDFLCSNG